MNTGEKLQFDYYRGTESEQFTFYRVPRMLMKDSRFKTLSSDAKLMYGLMLDRLSLSARNEWYDDYNRVYIIYTVDEMMDDLNCSKPTCVRFMKELSTIGLIEKKRRGQGFPDIIYVMNFATAQQQETDAPADTPTDVSAENRKTENAAEILPADSGAECGKDEFQNTAHVPEKQQPEPENEPSETKKTPVNPHKSSEVKNLYFKKLNSFTSRSKKSLPLEVKNFNPNYTDYSYTDRSEILRNPSIHLSGISEPMPDQIDGIDRADPVTVTTEKNGSIDAAGERLPEDVPNRYIEQIKKNVDYELFMNSEYMTDHDRELYRELVEIICDVVHSSIDKNASVRIGGSSYPAALIRDKFLHLTSAHLEYVMDSMKKTSSKIGNIRSYMITALYNAPSTMDYYYQQEANSDRWSGAI